MLKYCLKILFNDFISKRKGAQDWVQVRESIKYLNYYIYTRLKYGMMYIYKFKKNRLPTYLTTYMDNYI